MSRTIRIPKRYAGFALPAFLGAWLLFSIGFRAEGFWRDPATELRSALLGPHYFARYDCAGTRAPKRGFTLTNGFGFYGFRYAAADDADAIAFARSARPDCRLNAVTRRNRRVFLDYLHEPRYERVYTVGRGRH
ncbi:hypothetical protein DDZ18_11175 [Marinicauda salina]|uniref:Uncharacterized protein n=1 Tax=Marinicauda salina TaxID=2135793 RepID=A0A2U2BRV5_9PROT|nr:hypothetical protein [Marinicauda salina]PWE16754.1 hypothetical protein DDZ18_11175 [Marinicauda salina]